MLCPKCGSGTHKLNDGVIFCDNLMCDWNSLNPTYQQRLDNVLKKFALQTFNRYNSFNLHYGLDIKYIKKAFYLMWVAEDDIQDMKISLKTVESLLEDLKND